MRHGERDQPWPVQRGATKLEREDLEERKELRRLARQAGAASLCAEQIYRMKEEDTLGRHVILTVYILLNVYKFTEAYFRWVDIVDSQGTCCQVTLTSLSVSVCLSACLSVCLSVCLSLENRTPGVRRHVLRRRALHRQHGRCPPRTNYYAFAIIP
eukprot:COSAG03_NODE_914_length_5353_cov_33.767606_2_plen_156_part_00